MHCPRCKNILIDNHDEVYCYACAWRPVPVDIPPPDNHLHRWISVLCERCNERQAIKGWSTCRECRVKWGKRAQPIGEIES